MNETDSVIEQRKHLESQLYQLRNGFQQNLLNILENDGIEGMENITPQSIDIIYKIRCCEEKLTLSLGMSAEMMSELMWLRQTEWELR